MAKRSRGPSRPGQRRRTQRSSRPAAPTRIPAPPPGPATGLTEAEEARAAELEAGIVAEERAVAPESWRSADRARTANDDALALRGRPRGGLEVRFADEYAYVARDLRRIAVLAAVLLGVMLVLFILIEATGVIKI